MARTRQGPHKEKKRPSEPVPPGATRAALDRLKPPRPGAPQGGEPSGGDPGSGAGERHAAGTPGGGTEVGGLGGSTVGEGAPENADLDAALGSATSDSDLEEGTANQVLDTDTGQIREADAPYAGSAGGAVGGTPAGKRSRGGRTHRGIAPGGSHRGDSTLGSPPDKGAK